MHRYAQREGLGMANLLVGMTENDMKVNSYCNNSKQQHLGLVAMDQVLTLQFIHLLKIGSMQIQFFSHLHITVMARLPVFI